MVAVVTSNFIQGRDNRAPAPAVQEDGSSFPYRMFFEENQRIVDSDTTAEALDFLIPNYTLLSTEDQTTQRYELAQRVQILARSSIIASIEPVDAEDIADWEWGILNFGDINGLDPYGWGDGTGVVGTVDDEVVDFWGSKYPLVLLDTSFSPYTDILPPVSSEGDYVEVKNIIWIRPTGELEFLRSLSRIGFITFGTPAPTMNGE